MEAEQHTEQQQIKKKKTADSLKKKKKKQRNPEIKRTKQMSMFLVREKRKKM